MSHLIKYYDASAAVRAVYDYCIASHTATAWAKGMSETMQGELLAIVVTANTTNRLANGYQVPIDEQFKSKQ